MDIAAIRYEARSLLGIAVEVLIPNALPDGLRADRGRRVGAIVSEAENLRLLDYLQHIRDAIFRIGRYVKGLDEPRFFTDNKTHDAVIRNPEIIGEASNKIASHLPEFTAQHPKNTRTTSHGQRAT